MLVSLNFVSVRGNEKGGRTNTVLVVVAVLILVTVPVMVFLRVEVGIGRLRQLHAEETRLHA
jgi:amino acid transporter